MMKRHVFSACLLMIVTLSIPTIAVCGGFLFFDQGVRAASMGNTFAAVADDPSAVFYNPAGIGQLESTQISNGTFSIIGKGSFKSYGTSGIKGFKSGDRAEWKDPVFLVPSFYVTDKLSETVSVGIGEFTNFGLGYEWKGNRDKEWEGTFVPGGMTGSLITVNVNPVVAWQPFEKLWVAGGLVLQYAEVEFGFKVQAANTEVIFEGDAMAIGWNVGLLYEITENIKWAFTHRSDTKQKFDDLEIKMTGPVSETLGCKTTLTLPNYTSMGIAWTGDHLTLAFDAIWAEWSKMDVLEVEFDKSFFTIERLPVKFGYVNSWDFFFGMEYSFNRHVDLRAGITIDESPVPEKMYSPIGVNGDAVIYSMGAGLKFLDPKWESFTVDFMVGYVDVEDAQWNNSLTDPAGSNPGEPLDLIAHTGDGRITGVFKSEAIHIGIGLTYRF